MSADGAALTTAVGKEPCSLLDLSRGQTYVRWPSPTAEPPAPLV
jgi:hypothetical protein